MEPSVGGGGEEPRVALYERHATAGPSERAALAQAIEHGSAPWRDGVVRWRLIELVQWNSTSICPMKHSIAPAPGDFL